ncbi:MAG: sigma-70 family RNA polymerase sigma factor [Actinomycetota bacterium]
MSQVGETPYGGSADAPPVSTHPRAPRWDYRGSGEKLTQAQEGALSAQAQRGDRAAFERMVNANVPLVISVVRNYSNARLEPEDLVQEGMLGLCRAVERFDASKGFRFSTYATYWIKQRVLRALDRQSRLIRLPVDVGGAARKLDAVRERLAGELGREPTPEELAEGCGISARRLQAVMECLQDPISLDAGVQEDGGPLNLDIPDPRGAAPEAEMVAAEERGRLDELLDSLPARDRAVLEARFGLAGAVVPLSDLADVLRISKEGVRQIQRRALLKLRKRWPELQMQAA